MQSTSFFDLALLRLKRQLDADEDQQVAEVLGLSKAAFSARKTRGSFPEKELRSFVQKRPDLGIDVDYVLTGITGEVQALLETKQARIGRAVDAGASIEDIRASEAHVSGPTPERLESMSKMLSGMRVTEFDAVYTLAKTITDLRSALGATANVLLEPDGRYPKAVGEPMPTLHDERKKAL